MPLEYPWRVSLVSWLIIVVAVLWSVPALGGLPLDGLPDNARGREVRQLQEINRLQNAGLAISMETCMHVLRNAEQYNLVTFRKAARMGAMNRSRGCSHLDKNVNLSAEASCMICMIKPSYRGWNHIVAKWVLSSVEVPDRTWATTSFLLEPAQPVPLWRVAIEELEAFGQEGKAALLALVRESSVDSPRQLDQLAEALVTLGGPLVILDVLEVIDASEDKLERRKACFQLLQTILARIHSSEDGNANMEIATKQTRRRLMRFLAMEITLRIEKDREMIREIPGELTRLTVQAQVATTDKKPEAESGGGKGQRPDPARVQPASGLTWLQLGLGVVGGAIAGGAIAAVCSAWSFRRFRARIPGIPGT